MGLPLNIVLDVQKPQADKKTESLYIKCGWVLFVCLFLFQTFLGSFTASSILRR